ncbi:MAG TPA: (4Fe-4S)-binding protein [candidate division Zixibacteria bacterium]|nr:(4Fe-4S)-binding protein [candidate division Zixibacteria bacterium]
MKIAIASGKGGTGKTTLATNFADSLAHSGMDIRLLDCDTEEPNVHLFFDIAETERRAVTMPIPKLLPDKCTGCGICGNVCRFSAIVNIGKMTIIHPGMCHGCTACWELCPENALEPSEKPLGELISGKADGISITYGKLHIGEMSGNRIIQAVKAKADANKLNIIDAPPGTSCPVVETLSEMDFVLLAAEPTPFGLANLRSIVELAERLSVPMGIVINRSTPEEDGIVESFAESRRISILGKIPLDRKIAELYSAGEIFSRRMPEYRAFFVELLSKIERAVSR